MGLILYLLRGKIFGRYGKGFYDKPESYLFCGLFTAFSGALVFAGAEYIAGRLGLTDVPKLVDMSVGEMIAVMAVWGFVDSVFASFVVKSADGRPSALLAAVLVAAFLASFFVFHIIFHSVSKLKRKGTKRRGKI